MPQNDLAIKVSSFAESAAIFRITGSESFETANQRRQTAKSLIKEIEETFDPIVDKAKATLEEARAQRDKYLKPAKAADELYKGLMLAWMVAENKRIADENEKTRKEAQAKADQEKLDRATKAEAAGDHHRVEDILDAPAIFTPPPPLAAPKAKGFSTRMDWDFEVTNAAIVPIEYRMLDLSKIRGVVKAMKAETRIPGIRVFEKPVAVSR